MVTKSVRVDEKKFKKLRKIVKSELKTTLENAFDEMISDYLKRNEGKHGA